MDRHTEDEGDGDLLGVFVAVHGKFLKQSPLVLGQDDPGGQRKHCHCQQLRHFPSLVPPQPIRELLDEIQ